MIFIMLSTDPVKQKLEKQQREMENNPLIYVIISMK